MSGHADDRVASAFSMALLGTSVNLFSLVPAAISETYGAPAHRRRFSSFAKHDGPVSSGATALGRQRLPARHLPQRDARECADRLPRDLVVRDGGDGRAPPCSASCALSPRTPGAVSPNFNSATVVDSPVLDELFSNVGRVKPGPAGYAEADSTRLR